MSSPSQTMAPSLLHVSYRLVSLLSPPDLVLQLVLFSLQRAQPRHGGLPQPSQLLNQAAEEHTHLLHRLHLRERNYPNFEEDEGVWHGWKKINHKEDQPYQPELAACPRRLSGCRSAPWLLTDPSESDPPGPPPCPADALPTNTRSKTDVT